MKATVYLLAGSAVALAVAYAGLSAAGYRPVAVYSGSMRPTLGVGSLAFVRAIDSSTVRTGDVITFKDPYIEGRLVTHRVVQIIRTKRGPAYRTKGDANPTRDPWTIRLNGKVGRLAFRVPLAGYALVYVHTRAARGVLTVFAALLLFFALLQWIWRPGTAAATP